MVGALGERWVVLTLALALAVVGWVVLTLALAVGLGVAAWRDFPLEG